MFHRTDKKKSNNKGFSLVELIVVIAIMAVLVAVLAPQFTKYIDQSRKSNDAATVAGIVTAAQVGIADTTNYNIPEATYTITLTTTKAVVQKNGTEITADGSKNLADAIKDACGDLSGLKITSENWKDTGATASSIVIEIKYANGAVSVDYKTNVFDNYINGKSSDTNN